MSRQLEQADEDRVSRRSQKLGRILDYELEAFVARAGGELVGFSVRCGVDDYLMTLRVVMAGRRQIAFVGSDSLGGVFLKAASEASRDKLQLKPDKYST